ncbi:MAG: hypothetical protein ACT4OZ_08500 [Gemmatimonadota bacterium]
MVGEDASATAAVALGVARTQALHRRVFVGDLLGAGSPLQPHAGDAEYGLSDMMRYGVSLGRIAIPQPDSPNLFAVPGGADSPLNEEVLSADGWRSLSDQVHRAGALLVIAAPSRQPGLDRAVRQLDGVLLVDDAVLTGSGIKSLGEVRTAATMRTPAMTSRVVPGPAKRSWLEGRAAMIGGGLVLGALAVALAVPWVRSRLLSPFGGDSTSASATDLPPIPPPIERLRPTSDAAWSVELMFSNSEDNALARAIELADSVPATTFSAPVIGTDSTTWQRLVAGAFSDSLSAESFLSSLRTRGLIAAGAGLVLHTHLAFLLDSTLDASLAGIRVSAYQARGIPAYGLRDSLGVWRIWAGAFGDSADGGLMRRRLDSLNIQSILKTRVGSER